MTAPLHGAPRTGRGEAAARFARRLSDRHAGRATQRPIGPASLRFADRICAQGLRFQRLLAFESPMCRRWRREPGAPQRMWLAAAARVAGTMRFLTPRLLRRRTGPVGDTASRPLLRVPQPILEFGLTSPPSRAIPNVKIAPFASNVPRFRFLETVRHIGTPNVREPVSPSIGLSPKFVDRSPGTGGAPQSSRRLPSSLRKPDGASSAADALPRTFGALPALLNRRFKPRAPITRTAAGGAGTLLGRGESSRARVGALGANGDFPSRLPSSLQFAAGTSQPGRAGLTANAGAGLWQSRRFSADRAAHRSPLSGRPSVAGPGLNRLGVDGRATSRDIAPDGAGISLSGGHRWRKFRTPVLLRPGLAALTDTIAEYRALGAGAGAREIGAPMERGPGLWRRTGIAADSRRRALGGDTVRFPIGTSHHLKFVRDASRYRLFPQVPGGDFGGLRRRVPLLRLGSLTGRLASRIAGLTVASLPYRSREQAMQRVPATLGPYWAVEARGGRVISDPPARLGQRIRTRFAGKRMAAFPADWRNVAGTALSHVTRAANFAFRAGMPSLSGLLRRRKRDDEQRSAIDAGTLAAALIRSRTIGATLFRRRLLSLTAEPAARRRDGASFADQGSVERYSHPVVGLERLGISTKRGFRPQYSVSLSELGAEKLGSRARTELDLPTGDLRLSRSRFMREQLRPARVRSRPWTGEAASRDRPYLGRGQGTEYNPSGPRRFDRHEASGDYLTVEPRETAGIFGATPFRLSRAVSGAPDSWRQHEMRSARRVRDPMQGPRLKMWERAQPGPRLGTSARRMTVGSKPTLLAPAQPEEREPYARLSPARLAARLSTRSAGGRRLDSAMRAKLSPHLGFDPHSARIHEGPEVTEAARQLRADAFTVGGDVFFGAHQFKPATLRGLGLLAHELTHVGQQRRLAPSLRFHTPQGGDQMEHEAQQTALQAIAAEDAPGTMMNPDARAPRPSMAFIPVQGLAKVGGSPLPSHTATEEHGPGTTNPAPRHADPKAVADKVYELMKHELSHLRRFSGGGRR